MHLIGKDKQLKAKGWLKVFQVYGAWKQGGVVILITDKADFKLTLVRRDKEGHFILIEGTIHQEEITMQTYMHQMLEHPISQTKHY
jgi:hypothetical protein